MLAYKTNNLILIMPIFQLAKDKIVFPSPMFATKSGLLAIGGDLSEKRLLKAYSLGIFPWYSQGEPILWWSPNPRLVLIPEELYVSRSLRQFIKKGHFTVTMDTAFESVIRNCATAPRNTGGGTWITNDMINAYVRLHHLGYAHSVESWQDGELVGGLYGVSLGACFFGESMFSIKSNGSKVAFTHFVQQAIKWNFMLIDCQVKTDYLLSFGAKEIHRSMFMQMLHLALSKHSRIGKWQFDENFTINFNHLAHEASKECN
jgi:leucyl/phenylalanyl-tRNA--protein transferase